MNADEIEGVQPGEFLTIKVDHPIVSFVSVSPEVATRWLAHNTHNRPISEMGVMRYQSDMEEGRFQFTGDPIQFSKTGVLLNGQNRLTALANTVPPIKPLVFTVVRGLDDTVQAVMDQGIKRTPGQQLGLLGIKNAGQIASMGRLVIAWENGLLFGDSKTRRAISTARVEEWVASNQSTVEQFNTFLAQPTRRVGGQPSVAGAVAFQGLRIDPQATVAFFHLLKSRANLPPGSPLIALDNRLRRIRTEQFKTNQRDELAYFITAWNAWMRGENLTKIQAGRGGWSVANFPAMTAKRGRNFDKEQLTRGLELGGME